MYIITKRPLGTLLQIMCTLLVIILFRYSLYEFCGSMAYSF